MLKKQSLYLVSTLAAAIALTACQPKQKNDQEQSKTAASEVVPATPRLSGELQRLNLNMPSCQGNDCSELTVERLQSNQKFIDETIDNAILAILKSTLTDAPLNETTALESPASEAEIPSAKLKLEQKTAPYKEAFLNLDKELKSLSAGHPISVTVRPKILNAEAPLVTVVLNSSSYLGGAHGSTAQQYYNFDLNTQKRIALKDILQPKQDAVLKEKAYAAFKAWVIETELADNVSEYEQSWKFVMTDNFYLGKQGLILQYAEYEIGPYVVGLPRLVIPYSELNGILKSDYMPEIKDQVAEKKPDATAAQVENLVNTDV